MAFRIPRPAGEGQPVGSVEVDALNPAFFNVRARNTSPLGRQLQELGGTLANVAVEVDRRIDEKRREAAMLEVQERVDQIELDALDPENGLFARRLKDAEGATEDAAEMFSPDQFEPTLEGLGRSGRRAVEQYIRQAQQRLTLRAADHELKELQAYQKATSAARISTLGDIAARDPQNPKAVERALLGAQIEADARADELGLPVNSTARLQMMAEANDQIVSKLVAATELKAGANAALEQLQGYRELMTEDVYLKLNSALEDPARHDRALTMAENIFRGRSASFVGTMEPAEAMAVLLPSVIQAESGGDPDAVNQNPDGSFDFGLLQLNSNTVREPGLGVTPYKYADGVLEGATSGDVQAEQLRFGRDYLTALLQRYGNDAEAALIAWNAGMSNADKWLKAGRDYGVLPRADITKPHVQRILKGANLGGEQALAEGAIQAQIDQIEDPREARLVREKLDTLVSAEAARKTRAQNIVLDQAYAKIDSIRSDPEAHAGTTWDSFLSSVIRPGMDPREFFGTKLPVIRQSFERAKAGMDTTTDEATFDQLLDMAMEDPRKFVEHAGNNFAQFRDKLATADYRKLEDTARVLRSSTLDVNKLLPSASQIKSEVNPIQFGLEVGEETDAQRWDRAVRFAQNYLLRQAVTKDGVPRETPFNMLEVASAVKIALETDVTVKTGDSNFFGFGATAAFSDQSLVKALQRLDREGAKSADLIAAAERGTLEVGGIVLGKDFARALRALEAQYLRDNRVPSMSASELLEELIASEGFRALTAIGPEGIVAMREQARTQVQNDDTGGTAP